LGAALGAEALGLPLGELLLVGRAELDALVLRAARALAGKAVGLLAAKLSDAKAVKRLSVRDLAFVAKAMSDLGGAAPVGALGAKGAGSVRAGILPSGEGEALSRFLRAPGVCAVAFAGAAVKSAAADLGDTEQNGLGVDL
jgi:hypothetical protein